MVDISDSAVFVLIEFYYLLGKFFWDLKTIGQDVRKEAAQVCNNVEMLDFVI